MGQSAAERRAQRQRAREAVECVGQILRRIEREPLLWEVALPMELREQIHRVVGVRFRQRLAKELNDDRA